jgi:hypothetical protein
MKMESVNSFWRWSLTMSYEDGMPRWRIVNRTTLKITRKRCITYEDFDEEV